MKTPEPMANAAPNAFMEPPPIGQNRQYTCSAAVNKGRGSLMVDGEIGYWGITSKMVRDRLDEIGNVSDIDVVINSPGGLIGEGVAIYNALKRNPANIHVSIEGYALSMGSIIAMAGDTVSMADNSLMMIHNPIGGAWGDAETLRKEAEVLDKHKSALVSSYTSRPQVSMSEEEVIDAMNAETWYTAAEARAVGLVDEVIETGDESVNTYAAQLPVAAVQNAPEWVHQIRDRAVAMSVKPPVSTGTTTPEEDFMNIAAARPAAGADPVATTPEVTVDVDQERQNAVAAERTRASGIRKAFATRLPTAKATMIDRYIDGGESVEAVERVITDLIDLGADTTPVGGDAHIMADQRDKTHEGMLNALMVRTGNRNYKRDPQNEFNGMTLFEMCGESLRRAGVKPDSTRKLDRVGAAFTHSTTDFPSVLTDVVRRTVMDAYRERPESFEEFTRAVSLPDFRAAKRVGMLELDELDLKPEGAEYKHKSLSEFYEMISLDTYGNKVGITREAIINDDLGLLTDIPTKMGRMARRTIAAKVFNVFSANPLMADGDALFHTSHGNLAGTGAVLSTASVDAALTAMATNLGRYSANDSMQPLNVVPDILLVPMALRARAMTVMESEYKVHVGATDTNRDPNTVRNAMRVVADPRLDAISATAWYLIDSTNMPIERAFLDGEQEPYIDSVRGWDIDGTEFKIRLDLGVAPVEYSTIYKQPGA